MKEQRRHHRIRFNSQLIVRVGQFGCGGIGELENLSPGGLMFRTVLPLKLGEVFGCEFTVFDSPLIDLNAVAVSTIGDLISARFQSGPVTERLIQGAIDDALASGKGSRLSINEVQGRKVMRVAGGFNDGVRNDFLYNLTRIGVDELDLSGVTGIDNAGLELCRLAVNQHKVGIVHASLCVRAGMACD